MATGRVPTTANSPLTAKGDLFGYSTTQARVAVGSDGETLVADSAATTGLRWNPSPSLGNPIINGAYDIAQRGTSFTTAGGYEYTLDRWISRTGAVAGSMVTTRETTGDTTNLPFIQYCARVRRTTSNSNTNTLEFQQPIETTNSIPFVGRQVTFSFYARKSANFTGTLTALLVSGTGTDQGLPVTFTGVATVSSLLATLTTTWTRYTLTGTPSASATQLGIIFRHTPSGTAGADDYYEVTGVQIDLGAVALPFRRSGGTIQGELAACQRYYYLAVSGTDKIVCSGYYVSSTQVNMFIPFPVTMRIAPTLVATSGTDYYFIEGNGTNDAFNGLTIYRPTQNAAQMYVNSNVSGTAGYAGNIQTNNASASVAFNSEL